MISRDTMLAKKAQEELHKKQEEERLKASRSQQIKAEEAAELLAKSKRKLKRVKHTLNEASKKKLPKDSDVEDVE